MRSEDVRLVHEYDRGWRAFYVDDAEFDGQNMITEGTPLPLHEDPLDARPDYASLETLVRKKLKLPVYVRRMRAAGLRVAGAPRAQEAQAAGVRAADARGRRRRAALPSIE